MSAVKLLFLLKHVRADQEKVDGLRPGGFCQQAIEEERRGRPKEMEGSDQKRQPYLKWDKLGKKKKYRISLLLDKRQPSHENVRQEIVEVVTPVRVQICQSIISNCHLSVIFYQSYSPIGILCMMFSRSECKSRSDHVH